MNKASLSDLENFELNKKALNEQIEELQSEKQDQETANKKLKDLNRQLEFQVEELMEQLDTSDKARKDVKKEL